ncbi:MAG TPA: hypothetical protein PLP74_12420, partial [Quisquiliibacterium sp.]|nr:hypothetical protein [Quisquiliibacterium sp.]
MTTSFLLLLLLLGRQLRPLCRAPDRAPFFFGPFKRPHHTGRRSGMGLATTSPKVSVKSKIPRKINT